MASGQFDAVIIGSGLGGLTAAALLAHEGQKVLVLEQNDSFGGCATTYRKGALKIEAALHETTDPRATGDVSGIVFQKLDLHKDIEYVRLDNFYEVRSPLVGDPLTIPHGIDKVCDGLSERFPEESDSIRRFLAEVNSIQTIMHLFSRKHSLKWWLAHAAELPFHIWSLVRNFRSTLSDVLERYFNDNEAVKLALAANLLYYSDNPDRMWWISYAVAQGQFLREGGVFIKGGSQVLSDCLVDRIKKGGGETLAGHEAVKILLDDDRHVSGVCYRSHDDGHEVEVETRQVFANAAPHVVQSMLPVAEGERFMNQFLDKHLSISLMSITLGLNKKPSDLGLTAYITAIVPRWMEKLSDYKHCADLLANMPSGRLPLFGVTDYSHIESGMVENDLYPISIVLVDRLGNWNSLSNEDYHAKKDAWVEAIIERLENEWPGLGECIIQKEVFTARSFHKRLKTPEGAVYGFSPTVPDCFWKPPGTPKTAIDGLWLASAFGLGGGGFVGSMISGWAAATWADKYSKANA